MHGWIYLSIPGHSACFLLFDFRHRRSVAVRSFQFEDAKEARLRLRIFLQSHPALDQPWADDHHRHSLDQP